MPKTRIDDRSTRIIRWRVSDFARRLRYPFRINRIAQIRNLRNSSTAQIRESIPKN